MSRRRFAAVIVLFALLVPASAGARAAGLSFAMLPKWFVQNGMTTVVASLHPTSVCSLAVRYADGQFQPGLKAAGSYNGHAKWTFRVASGAAPGHATVMASCGRAGTIRRRCSSSAP